MSSETPGPATNYQLLPRASHPNPGHPVGPRGGAESTWAPTSGSHLLQWTGPDFPTPPPEVMTTAHHRRAKDSERASDRPGRTSGAEISAQACQCRSLFFSITMYHCSQKGQDFCFLNNHTGQRLHDRSRDLGWTMPSPGHQRAPGGSASWRCKSSRARAQTASIVASTPPRQAGSQIREPLAKRTPRWRGFKPQLCP